MHWALASQCDTCCSASPDTCPPTSLPPQPWQGSAELFLSDHEDSIYMSNVLRVVEVHSLEHYCCLAARDEQRDFYSRLQYKVGGRGWGGAGAGRCHMAGGQAGRYGVWLEVLPLRKVTGGEAWHASLRHCRALKPYGLQGLVCCSPSQHLALLQVSEKRFEPLALPM
jgi:hypothetical protein